MGDSRFQAADTHVHNRLGKTLVGSCGPQFLDCLTIFTERVNGYVRDLSCVACRDRAAACAAICTRRSGGLTVRKGLFAYVGPSKFIPSAGL